MTVIERKSIPERKTSLGSTLTKDLNFIIGTLSNDTPEKASYFSLAHLALVDTQDGNIMRQTGGKNERWKARWKFLQICLNHIDPPFGARLMSGVRSQAAL